VPGRSARAHAKFMDALIPITRRDEGTGRRRGTPHCDSVNARQRVRLERLDKDGRGEPVRAPHPGSHAEIAERPLRMRRLAGLTEMAPSGSPPLSGRSTGSAAPADG
jgi:hypothetical protein